MRRPLAATIAIASRELAKDHPFLHVTDGVKRDKLLADARHLLDRYGNLLQDRKHPAELDRWARQRRRARQTHPGKRGRA